MKHQENTTQRKKTKGTNHEISQIFESVDNFNFLKKVVMNVINKIKKNMLKMN